MVKFEGGCIVDNTDENLPEPPTDGWYYTQKEFAEIFDVPDATVRVWVKRGIIPGVHYYGHTYIPETVKFRYTRPWMRAIRHNKMQRK